MRFSIQILETKTQRNFVDSVATLTPTNKQNCYANNFEKCYSWR